MVNIIANEIGKVSRTRLEIPKKIPKKYISRKKKENYCNLVLIKRDVMEYQQVINLLQNTSNQPCKFRTQNWVETNDDSRGIYNTSQSKLKTRMFGFSLGFSSDSYILVKGTKIAFGKGVIDADRAADRTNKPAMLKNCSPFRDCLSKTDNTKVHNAKDLNVVMSMCNLKECKGN